MSTNLTPWIHDYLKDISQRLGVNYFSTVPATNPKKVQLLAFRGSRPMDNVSSLIWADVSDKAFTIPVVFTTKAIESYRQRYPIDQCEKAILSIKSFRPILRRIPLRSTTGLTDKAELALQCDTFSVAEKSLTDTLGQPAELDTSPDLNDWINVLRRAGGGGSTSSTSTISQKQSKAQLDGLVFAPRECTLHNKAESKGTLNDGKERAGLREVMSEHQDVTKIMREYDRWWCRHLDRNNQLEHLRRVTVNAEIRQSDFNSQPAKERQDVSGSESSMIFHPLTDSWSPSPRNSRTKPFEQIRKSQNQSVVKTTVSAQRPKASSGTAPILTKFARKIADSLDVGGSEPGDTSLHLSLPTRTQRPKKTVVPNRIVKSKSPLLSLDRSDVMVNPENRSHIYLSSPPSQMPLSRKSATQSAAFSPKHSTTFTDIQSHNLPSSFTLGHDGFLSSPSPGSSHGSVSRLLAADRVRKVPPSAQPNHLPINSQSTPKILAPNSDTSSQPFSQSQLQSQSWVHSQSQSQECPPSQLHPLFSQSLSQSQSELHSQLSYDLQPNVSAQFSAEVKPHSEPSLRLPQPFSQSFAPSGVSQHADVTQAVNLPPRSEQDAGDIDEHDSLFSADDYDDDLYRTRSSTRENTENGSLSVNPPDTQNDMDVDGLSDETSESDLESDKQSSMKCSNGQKHDGSDTESPNTGIKLDSDDFQTQTDLFGSLQKSQLQMAVRSRREKKRVSLGFDDLEEPTLSVSCSRASIIHHSPSAWAAPSFMRQTVAHESAEPLGSRSNYIRPDDTTRQQDKIVLGAPQRGNPQKSRPTTRIIGETLDEISRTRKKDTIATTRQTLPREDADNQMEGSVGMKRPSGNNQPHRPLKRGKRNASQSISAFGSGSAHTHTKLLGFSVALDKTGLQNVVSWSRMKNIILNTGKYQSVLRE